MFIVTLLHLGNEFYLRSTIWTSDAERATVHASEEAARAALEKARKFMKPAQYKAAKLRKVAG